MTEKLCVFVRIFIDFTRFLTILAQFWIRSGAKNEEKSTIKAISENWILKFLNKNPKPKICKNVKIVKINSKIRSRNSNFYRNFQGFFVVKNEEKTVENQKNVQEFLRKFE